MLPDYLAPGLKAVFCGTAAGRRSAERGHYYSGRGNSFWEVLHRTGLSPRLLGPEEDRLLPQFGLGLTDLSKGYAGMDRDIPEHSFVPARLVEICEAFRPDAVAFNGKKAAQIALSITKVGYGRVESHALPVGAVWVLPSTSGAARGFFDISIWEAFAATVRG